MYIDVESTEFLYSCYQKCSYHGRFNIQLYTGGASATKHSLASVPIASLVYPLYFWFWDINFVSSKFSFNPHCPLQIIGRCSSEFLCSNQIEHFRPGNRDQEFAVPHPRYEHIWDKRIKLRKLDSCNGVLFRKNVLKKPRGFSWELSIFLNFSTSVFLNLFTPPYLLFLLKCVLWFGIVLVHVNAITSSQITANKFSHYVFVGSRQRFSWMAFPVTMSNELGRESSFKTLTTILHNGS